MSNGRDQRGVALLAVLGVILALLPVAAAVWIQTNLDGLVQRHHRGSTQAFYAAEAGLAHALAEIPPSASLPLLVDGADGIPGTSDDGRFPFRAPPPDGLSYEVRVTTNSPSTIRLRSTGHGVHDAVREVEMLVGPSEVPYTPGAAYVEAAGIDLDLGTQGFSLSGIAAGEESAGVAAVAGLAVTSAAAAAASSASVQPAQIAGAGDPPSIVAAGALHLDAHVTTLRRHLEAVVLSTGPAGDVTLGTSANPQLTVVERDWRATSQVDGFGVLVVRGNFEIDGSFRYGGMVVIDGDLRVAETATVEIDGALWIHRTGKARIALLGSGSVRYDPGNLRRAAAALEASLMHLPKVVGWRELS